MQVSLEPVIARLSQQIGALTAELAMRDVVIEQQHAQIVELEAAAGQKDEEPGTKAPVPTPSVSEAAVPVPSLSKAAA